MFLKRINFYFGLVFLRQGLTIYSHGGPELSCTGSPWTHRDPLTFASWGLGLKARATMRLWELLLENKIKSKFIIFFLSALNCMHASSEAVCKFLLLLNLTPSFWNYGFLNTVGIHSLGNICSYWSLYHHSRVITYLSFTHYMIFVVLI